MPSEAAAIAFCRVVVNDLVLPGADEAQWSLLFTIVGPVLCVMELVELA